MGLVDLLGLQRSAHEARVLHPQEVLQLRLEALKPQTPMMKPMDLLRGRV